MFRKLASVAGVDRPVPGSSLEGPCIMTLT